MTDDEKMDRMAWDNYAAAALSGLLSGSAIHELNDEQRPDLAEHRIANVVGAAARVADAMMQTRNAIWK